MLFGTVTALMMLQEVLTFSIPGVSTQVYQHGEEISLYLNEMESRSNQVPYDPYFLKSCRPHKKVRDNFQNLGSLLLGEKTLNSPYQVFVGIDMQCQFLCEVQLSELDLNDYKWFIQHEYRHNMELDNLPLVMNQSTFAAPKYVITPGYPIGYEKNNEYYLYNHVSLKVEIHPVQENEYRIVGFQATPVSALPILRGDENTIRFMPYCADASSGLESQMFPTPQKLMESSIVFSYDVTFSINKDKTHGSRWDLYISDAAKDIQWFSVIFSLAIAIVLTGVIALLIRFALRRDILKYRATSDLPTVGEQHNDIGWKQLSRDVFRPPSNPMLFSVLVGTGYQLVWLILCTLLLACLGFVYQAHRGNIITLVIVIFVFTGSLNGFYSARFYKYFKVIHIIKKKGGYWLLCALLANLAYPSMVILTEWIVHLFLSADDSSSTVTFKTVITFLALWLGIQVPLNLLGSLLGFKLDSPKVPSKYYSIPQPIPAQPWYLEDFNACLIGGLLCFTSVGTQFSFIMQLMWQSAFYSFFASLMISVVLLCVISAEISIIFTYLSLQKGNHLWWWKAFMVPFTSGVYLMLYSLQYYMAELTFTRLSAIVFYFGTMFIVSLTFGLVCGTVGFLASFRFVRIMYSLIKHD